MLNFVLGILCAIFIILAILNGLHLSSLFLIISAIIILPIPKIKNFFERIFKLNLIPPILAFLVAFCGIAFYPSLSGKTGSNAPLSSILIMTDLNDYSSLKESKASSPDITLDKPSSEASAFTGSLNSSSEEALVSNKTETPNESKTSSKPEVEGAALDIEILEITSPIGNGQTATLEIKGKPNTLYSIAVYYGENKSTAKGLEDKTSDKNGKVSWQWRVGARTKTGKHKIVISNDKGTFITYFIVE